MPAAVPVVARPPVTEKVLPNGLRVVVIEHHRQPVVSVRAVFRQGAVGDRPDGFGATFFALSLLSGFYEVDGSNNRVVEADSFGRKVFYAGGDLKIDIAADQAYIGIDGYARDTAEYLSLLSSGVRKPRCGPTSFDIRRDAMINQLLEIELSDPAIFQLFIDRAAFGTGHPYARPVFGTVESLKELSLRQVQRRQSELLTPRGTTLIVAGDVNPSQVMVDVRSTWGKWRGAKASPLRRVAPPRLRTTSEVLLIPRTPAASMYICAARSLADIKGEDTGLRALAYLFGTGLDSRLGTELRTTSGLSYSVDASLLERRFARALVACTLVQSRDTTFALEIFRRTADKMATRPPSKDEFERVRRQLMAADAVREASTAGTIDAWLDALARGKRSPRVNSELRRLTRSQLYALARRVFAPGRVQFLLGGTPSEAALAAQAAGLGPVRRVRLDL